MKLHRFMPMFDGSPFALPMRIRIFRGKAIERHFQNIVQYKTGLKTSSLAAMPDNALLELPNGHRVSVGTIHNMENAAKIMRTSRISRTPATLKYLPDRNNVAMQVQNTNDLKAALKLPDSATVQLPSGQVATAGTNQVYSAVD